MSVLLNLNYNSVETLPGYEARAAFTVNSASVFKEDGLFVDYGTGRNTPRGNLGDLGKANGRLSPSGAFVRKNRIVGSLASILPR